MKLEAVADMLDTYVDQIQKHAQKTMDPVKRFRLFAAAINDLAEQQKTLEELQRHIISQQYMQGWTLEQIASRFGISQESADIKSQRFRGRVEE